MFLGKQFIAYLSTQADLVHKLDYAKETFEAMTTNIELWEDSSHLNRVSEALESTSNMLHNLISKFLLT